MIDADSDEARARRSCLHCGKPTAPGRWRCDECQASHGAERDHVRQLVADNRRRASRWRREDQDGPRS